MGPKFWVQVTSLEGEAGLSRSRLVLDVLSLTCMIDI